MALISSFLFHSSFLVVAILLGVVKSQINLRHLTSKRKITCQNGGVPDTQEHFLLKIRVFRVGRKQKVCKIIYVILS